MKIQCNVIKDLLPLYAEKLTSKESNSLILDHISNCQDCKNEYEKIIEKFDLPNNLNDFKNLKKAKRKDRQNLIIGIAVIVLSLALLFVILKPYFSYLYAGDRITLSIYGESDYNKIDISEKDVVCKYENKNQEFQLEKDDEYIISTKGNEYGLYTFDVTTKQGNINIQLMHTNWWSIEDIDLYFNIDTDSKILTYKIADTVDSCKLDRKTNSYTIYYMT